MATKLPIEALLALEARLDRSFTACVGVVLLNVAWLLYLMFTRIAAAAWVDTAQLLLALLLLPAYGWLAHAASAAAAALEKPRALFLAWMLGAPFAVFLPVPFLGRILAITPLSVKFFLSAELRAEIHARTFADD